MENKADGNKKSSSKVNYKIIKGDGKVTIVMKEPSADGRVHSFQTRTPIITADGNVLRGKAITDYLVARLADGITRSH